MSPWQHTAGAYYNGVLYVINCRLRLTKISKLTFKGEVNYHATAHHTIKMESIHI